MLNMLRTAVASRTVYCCRKRITELSSGSVTLAGRACSVQGGFGAEVRSLPPHPWLSSGGGAGEIAARAERW
jgi:hypothetical protein